MRDIKRLFDRVMLVQQMAARTTRCAYILGFAVVTTRGTTAACLIQAEALSECMRVCFSLTHTEPKLGPIAQTVSHNL